MSMYKITRKDSDGYENSEFGTFTRLAAEERLKEHFDAFVGHVRSIDYVALEVTVDLRTGGTAVVKATEVERPTCAVCGAELSVEFYECPECDDEYACDCGHVDGVVDGECCRCGGMV